MQLDQLPEKFKLLLNEVARRTGAEIRLQEKRCNIPNMREWIVLVGGQPFSIWQNPTGEWGWDYCYGPF